MAHQLLLVRHAAIGQEYTGRYVGHTDVVLDSYGRNQAGALVPLIRSRQPERCFCSPLIRARQTAETLCESEQLPVQVDNDLREIDFGRWENRTFAEIVAEDPELVDRWAEWHADFAFPDGESIDCFATRIRRVADRLAAEARGVILVVTHGGVIRGMLCHFLGLHPRDHLLFHVRHAACATVDLFDGKGVLSGLNERCLCERD